MLSDDEKQLEHNGLKNNNADASVMLSDEARLSKLSNQAMKLVEKHINEGTASSQEITTILKMHHDQEMHKLDLELKRADIELNKAKVEALRSAKSSDDLTKKAMRAMYNYRGVADAPEEVDDYDEE